MILYEYFLRLIKHPFVNCLEDEVYERLLYIDKCSKR